MRERDARKGGDGRLEAEEGLGTSGECGLGVGLGVQGKGGVVGGGSSGVGAGAAAAVWGRRESGRSTAAGAVAVLLVEHGARRSRGCTHVPNTHGTHFPLPGRIDVTTALLGRWCAAARGDGGKPPALGSFGFLVRAYRLACHYGDPSGGLAYRIVYLQ